MIEASGEWADAVQDDATVLTAAEAAAHNDMISVLAALPGVTADVTITLLGQDSVHSWVRVADAFVREFERTGWFGFAQLVAPTPGAASHVVVLDADDAVVRSEGMVVHGPRAWPASPPWTGDVRVSSQEGDPRSGVPSPAAVMPIDGRGESLSAVAASLEAVAGALAWLWMADSVGVVGPVVTVRLAGNRPIEGELPECPVGYASRSVELWSWASLSTQPGRRHAVLQAVTLQAEEPKDLYIRASSILDTAQFLFSLSQSGLIQEALAARRSARDSAVSAGRSAADRAGAAARSAVDRVLVVVAAGVGLVLANKGELITRPITLGLLVLAAALILGAGLLVFHLDLPAAARSVDLFRAELEQHAEVLAPRDIQTIAQLPSLVDGSDEVGRARTASMAIIGVAALALLSLAGTVIAGQGPTQPGTTGSTTIVTTGQVPTTTVTPPLTVAPPPISTATSNP